MTESFRESIRSTFCHINITLLFLEHLAILCDSNIFGYRQFLDMRLKHESHDVTSDVIVCEYQRIREVRSNFRESHTE